MYERILIVCSGPSVRPEHLETAVTLAGVHIMAGNGAVDHLTRCESWITVDPSGENLARMTGARPGTAYYAAIPPARETPPHVRRLVRMEGDGVLSARRGLSEDPLGVHTGNSGYGA